MSGVYQHRSLVPTAAPVGSAPQSVSASRLNDLLEFVKQEFDVVGTDAQQFRGQRDEFEHRIGQQVSEVQMIQQHIVDLEARHSSLAQQYEEEIKRLRQILESRDTASSDFGLRTTSPRLHQQQQQGPPLPIAPVEAPGKSRVLGAPPGLDIAAHAHQQNGGYERDRKGGSDSKRMRADGGQPHPGYSGAPSSPGRDAAGSKADRDAVAAGGRRSGGGTGYQSTPSQSSNALAATSAPVLPPHREEEPSAGPGAAGSTVASWSDLDPDDVPKELKKEGSDWIAFFNPTVKRTLDVNLVHTLMHESVVCCVRFSPDGKYLATGCNRSAQIYDTKTGAKVCILMEPAAASKGDLYIRSVCFSPDGKFLATGAEDRQVRVWDIARKKVRNVFTGHKQEIYSLDWSRDGSIIASGSGDKTVRIWDVESGNLLHTLYTSPGLEQGPSEAGVTSVSISSDNRLVAAGALDTLVRVWDTKTGQQLERLKSHKDSIYSVAFTPDGDLVSGSLDKTLKMWDLSGTRRVLGQVRLSEEERTGKAVCSTTFSGHKDYVLSVSTSSDGQWIASGSKDRGIQFWNPKTGQTQLILMGHKNSVIAIHLSPAGGLLASGSGDFNARIWSHERVGGI